MKPKRDLDPLCGINWAMVDAWRPGLVMWVVVVILIAVIAVHLPAAPTVSHATTR